MVSISLDKVLIEGIMSERRGSIICSIICFIT